MDKHTFINSPPPRTVPIGSVVSGGTAVAFFIGLVFFAIGMLITALIFFMSDVSIGLDNHLEKNGIETTGEVVEIHNTNTVINDEYVVRIIYAFNDSEGFGMMGHSYTHNWRLYDKLEQGSPIIVIYDPDKPEEHSKMKGTTASQMPWWIFIFVLIFPGIGALLMGIMGIAMYSNFNFLRNGEIVQSIIDNVSQGLYSVNNVQQMKYTYVFHDKVGNKFTGTVTDNEDKFEERDQVHILYMPTSPKKNTLLEGYIS